MKKKLMIFAYAALAVAIYVIANRNNNDTRKMTITSLDSDEIEVLSACESIGWWDNDGNCVKNDAGEYFCKSDTWHEITDCLQNK